MVAQRAVIMPVCTVTTGCVVMCHASIPINGRTTNDLVHDVVCRREASLMLTLHVPIHPKLENVSRAAVNNKLTKCQTRAMVMAVSATAEKASQMMTMTWNFWKWMNSGIL